MRWAVRCSDWTGPREPRPPSASRSGSAVLVVLIGLGWVSWRLLPHYVTHYLIEDDVTVIARTPIRDDAVIRDRLAHAVRHRGLQDHLRPERCRIETELGWRRISCRYAIEMDLLPGLRRTLQFQIDVEQPYLAEPNPVLL